jgi:hypothetical protein
LTANAFTSFCFFLMGRKINLHIQACKGKVIEKNWSIVLPLAVFIVTALFVHTFLLPIELLGDL